MNDRSLIVDSDGLDLTLVSRPGWSFMPGPRSKVQGPRSLILDTWYLILDTWSMILDTWYLIVDLWSLILDPWSLILDPWSMIHDPWSMIHDPWSMMGSLCSAYVTPVRVRSGSGPVPVGPVPVGPVPSAKCVDLRAPWGALGPPKKISVASSTELTGAMGI